MTQFKDFELICNQYFNLISEISSMIQEEQYETVIEKMEYKNKLIKKLFLAKKTVQLTEEEKEKTNLIEQKIRDYEAKTLSSLEELHKKIGEELKNANKQVKINSAYSIQVEDEHGVLINISE